MSLTGRLETWTRCVRSTLTFVGTFEPRPGFWVMSAVSRCGAALGDSRDRSSSADSEEKLGGCKLPPWVPAPGTLRPLKPRTASLVPCSPSWTDHLLGPLPPVPTQPPTPAQAPAGQGLRVRRGTQRNAGRVGTRGSDVPAGGTACLPPRPHPVRIPVDSVIETNKLCKINKC